MFDKRGYAQTKEELRWARLQRPERPVVVMTKLNVMEDASFQLRRRMAAVWNCSVAEAEALSYSRVQSVAMAVVYMPMEQPKKQARAHTVSHCRFLLLARDDSMFPAAEQQCGITSTEP